MALSGGPIFRAPSSTYQAPVQNYGLRLNCFENQIGDSVYTNCY
jgi:hypothetical protein